MCVCVSSVYSFLGRNTGSWDYLGRECFSIPSLQSKIFNGNAKELPRRGILHRVKRLTYYAEKRGKRIHESFRRSDICILRTIESVRFCLNEDENDS